MNDASLRPRLPLPLRALNAVGRAARAAGLPLLELDAEAQLAAASARSGLSDFGDPRFRAPLRLLFDSYQRDARLTAFGRMLVRRDAQRLLENRLHLVDTLSKHPEILRGEIRAPIFVLGLPRTGTSILHELLAQDPANRVPMTWEVQRLWPPPERESFETDPRIAEAERHYSGVDRVLPDFKRIHRMGARLPQECVALTCHDFASLVFHTSHRVPSYQEWLDSADLRFVYESHRRQLQYLQWRCPAERWVLKSPGHLWALSALLAVYPDARIVQTHRDPLRVLASLAHLVTVLRSMASDAADTREIGADWTRRLADGLERTIAVRTSGALPPERVFDIQFGEFVGNEIATIRRLYEHFGLALSGEAEARMARYLAANPKDGQGTHRYALGEAGLDAAGERRRYAAYQEHFRVPDEALP
jgi:Sulfotransferase family